MAPERTLRRGTKMERRAQGATEYIILLGISLLVVVAAISFVVVEPQFAYAAKKQRSDEYWANARPFMVKGNAISQSGAILEVQNAEPVSLSITGITLDGVAVNFFQITAPYNESAVPMCDDTGCSMQMSPGKTAMVMTETLDFSEVLQNICSTGGAFQEGRKYEANLSFAYQNAGGVGEAQGSNIPIIGQCVMMNVTGA